MIRFLATHAAAAARSRPFLCALAAAFSLAFPLTPLRAAITATGDVEPADPATWTTSTEAYVGNSGTGALTVDGGSSLLSQNAYLGNETGSSGTVTITGTGSTWNSFFAPCVGNAGTGILNVTNGGAVNLVAPLGGGAMYIGWTAAGVVTVDGVGSTLNLNGSTKNTGSAGIIFNNGTLNVTNGGIVNSGSATISTGVVNVDGSGSTWNIDDLFGSRFALGGAANLNITAGGSVVMSSVSNISCGWGSAAVTVDGTGSNWSAANDVLQLGRLICRRISESERRRAPDNGMGPGRSRFSRGDRHRARQCPYAYR